MNRPAQAAPPELPGFEQIRSLGSGGFADVFLFRQRHPEREVAVKVMHAHRLDAATVEGFTAEANLMAGLAAHPHIVSVYETGVSADGRPFLVMEYCSRPNLQVRHRRERFSEAETLRIGVQIAGAVETAHRFGILHRDIKPANILVTKYDKPKLTDFGIAGSAASTVAGFSIPWSPPESFVRGGYTGPASDVYSLAATLYTLLTDRQPFEIPGGSNGEIDMVPRIQTMALPPTGRGDVSAALEAVLARAMAKDPAARYATALEFGRALQHVQILHGMQETPIDVEEDDILPFEDEGEEKATRFRGITSIDAQSVPAPAPAPAPAFPPVADTARTPTTSLPGVMDATLRRPPAAPAAPSWGVPAAPAPQDTIVRPPAAPVADDAPAPPSTGRSRRPLVLTAVAAGVVLLAAGGAVAAALTAPPPEPQSGATTAADPVDAEPDSRPVQVTGLTGRVTDAGVDFTWTNPDPQPGDAYLWRTVVPGTETTFAEVATPTVQVPVDASGRTCIEVLLRRADGTASATGVEGCAP
ncbi:serine/threonine-protein kinase [Microbacterium sp. SLBN-111]|uniref:serine/threonine-protein kinase n=1 Tax=Microbacterium sp. SLBN-111 TaxID=3377733 RepID=UPI003C7763C0